MKSHPHQRPDDTQLFRFAVISQVLARIARGQPRPAAVANVAALSHPDGAGRSRYVSSRSIYRWLVAYEKHGIEGLADSPRIRTPSRVDSKLIRFLISELKKDPEASIPELLRRARLLQIVTEASAPHRATVHRALIRHGIALDRAKKRRGRDSRRFAYPHRMDMVLCDGKFFRAGKARLRRVAMSFLDDATRKILHVVVGPSESAELFLRGLHACIEKHGLMSALYLDHGPGFVADATRLVAAALDIPLVLGKVAYPEGHGKVERYHRTLKDELLRFLDKRADVDPAFAALELRLRHYVDEVYGHSPHTSLGNETPHQRFFELDPKPLRLIKDPGVLESAFQIEHVRLVSNDHVVSLAGVLYEMPMGTAGRKVILRQRVLDQQVLFEHDGRLVQLQPLDAEANARAPRAKPTTPDIEEAPPPTDGSAAELHFRQDFPPLVDKDGGLLRDPANPPDDDDLPL